MKIEKIFPALFAALATYVMLIFAFPNTPKPSSAAARVTNSGPSYVEFRTGTVPTDLDVSVELWAPSPAENMKLIELRAYYLNQMREQSIRLHQQWIDAELEARRINQGSR